MSVLHLTTKQTRKTEKEVTTGSRILGESTIYGSREYLKESSPIVEVENYLKV